MEFYVSYFDTISIDLFSYSLCLSLCRFQYDFLTEIDKLENDFLNGDFISKEQKRSGDGPHLRYIELVHRKLYVWGWCLDDLIFVVHHNIN